MTITTISHKVIARKAGAFNTLRSYQELKEAPASFLKLADGEPRLSAGLELKLHPTTPPSQTNSKPPSASDSNFHTSSIRSAVRELLSIAIVG
jgi:hypothetical protein